MAMTKAEKERMANLEQAVKFARSMRWPDYGYPQAMTREQIDAAKVDGGIKWSIPEKVAFGYFANAYSLQVSHGCSNGISHNPTGNTTTTQGMGRMYRSEREAWMAVRLHLTEKYAKTLAEVDEKLAACGAD